MKGRTGSDSVFGGQLDLIIDIVSYGVAPAILLLSYGNFSSMLLPIAFVMIAAGAIRLSFFSTYGLSDEFQYTGLAIDNNSIAMVGLFLIESYLPQGVFLVILCIVSLGLATLYVIADKNVKTLREPEKRLFAGNLYHSHNWSLYLEVVVFSHIKVETCRFGSRSFNELNIL